MTGGVRRLGVYVLRWERNMPEEKGVGNDRRESFLTREDKKGFLEDI